MARSFQVVWLLRICIHAAVAALQTEKNMTTTPNWNRSLAAALALTAGSLLAAQGALASGSTINVAGAESTSVTVRYNDLDLSQPADAQTLVARVSGAAKQVCGTADLRRMREHQLWRQCYNDAVSTALAQLNDDQHRKFASAIDLNDERVN
jgi:UrcA family protein